MLTPAVKSQFVTKIISNETGKYRVVFLVALIDGKIKGQVVSAQQIEAGIKNQELRTLPAPAKKQAHTKSRPFNKILFPVSSFEFLTSIKIRAPSFQ